MTPLVVSFHVWKSMQNTIDDLSCFRFKNGAVLNGSWFGLCVSANEFASFKSHISFGYAALIDDEKVQIKVQRMNSRMVEFQVNRPEATRTIKQRWRCADGDFDLKFINTVLIHVFI